MMGHQIYEEPISVKALLIALSVLVITQIGATVFYLVILYGLAGDRLDWMLVLLSGIYGLNYALPTSCAAFVIAFVAFAVIEAVRRRKRPKSFNHSMELTASRRTIQFHMSSTSQFAATRAPARGSSSCSR